MIYLHRQRRNGRKTNTRLLKACILIETSKAKVHGIPKGTFLLAYYDNDNEKTRSNTLRAMGQVHLPNQKKYSALIEYYKEPNTRKEKWTH